MLNFLKGKLQRWGSKQANDELQYFVHMLEGCDVEGRALTVALGADLRNKVMTSPEFVEAREQDMGSMFLLKLYRELQKQSLLAKAAGCAVYLHTERARNDLTLMTLARRMWGLLEESFDQVEDVAYGHEIMTRRSIDLRDYDKIPEGFES